MTRPGSRGSTLIEVLFGLMILATLLAAIITARGRFMRQAADAQSKTRLIAALNAQLDHWFAAETPNIPPNDSGNLETLPGASWRTQTRSSGAAAALGGNILHVEAVDDHSNAISVDLLVHQLKRIEP